MYFIRIYHYFYISVAIVIIQTRWSTLKDFDKFDKLKNFFVTSHCGLKYITVAELSVELKNGVFLDVAPCGSCKNRRFGGT
jgi:hypothetical protein